MKTKKELEQVINLMWRSMVAGMQKADQTLATKWGMRQPEAFVDEKTGNPGLATYCATEALTILVEHNFDTHLYLLSVQHDGCDDIEPLTTVLAPEAIAPAIIEYMATLQN